MKIAKNVIVIGAANLDIQGFSSKPLIMRDSNPGKIKISAGGVGRNIAENLSRLDTEICLITCFADDFYSRWLMDYCINSGIDINSSLFLNNASSPIYLSILDNKRDMALAVCDADIIDQMTIELIESRSDILDNSHVIVLDTNIPMNVLKYCSEKYSKKAIFLDTVSTQKAAKITDFIGNFHTLKLNKLEAEILSNIKADSIEDLNRLSHFFINKGVKRVFITLGEEGVHYREGMYSKTLPSPKIHVINATGAGDAFMAGLVYSYLHNFDIDYSACFSTAAAILAISHEDTINPEMSCDNVYNKLKELKLC